MEHNDKFSSKRRMVVQLRRLDNGQDAHIPCLSDCVKAGDASIPLNVPVALLVESLHHSKLTVRAEGARRLGELGERAPIEPLLNALEDEERFVRAEAARALGKLGKRVPIAPLVTALYDRDGSVRVAAAQALGMLSKRGCLEDLVHALKDPWPPVREAVVLALGKWGKQVSLENFLTVLQDEDKFVRAATLSILGTLGKSVPIEPLMDALGDMQKQVREAAIQALVAQGERVPIEALGVVLNTSKWSPKREAAARVLSMLGERVPLELLESASADEWPPVRAAAEPALLRRFSLGVPLKDSDKRQLKGAISRLVAWQSAQFAQAYTPAWARQSQIALIVVSAILGIMFFFRHKKRISSAIMDSASRISQLPRTLRRKRVRFDM